MNAMAMALEKANVKDNVSLKEIVYDNGLTIEEVNSLEIAGHGYKRIRERLGISEEKEAREFVIDSLKKAIRVGLVIAKDGNESVCFSHEGVGFYLTKNYKKLVTITGNHGMTQNKRTNILESMKQEMIDIQMKKLRKIQRLHRKLSKQYGENYYDYKIEIAYLDKKIFKTSSERIREKSNDRRLELVNLIEEERKELEHLETDIRSLSKSVISINSK